MPPKGRGMSLEDKRRTLLAVFHESKDVFMLKEVEKLGSKRGVVLQSIKDVLQSLVDDDLVHCEKIGISNYFWSFESEATVKLETDKAKLQSRLQAADNEIQKLQESIKAVSVGREENEERIQLREHVGRLEACIDSYSSEIAQYNANDPERYAALKEATVVARDSANRWIDNIDSLRSWVKKRFQGNENQVDDFFLNEGAPEDINYV